MDKNFFCEEVRCNYRISTEMKHVWAIELDLVAKLKDVCDRNNLKYFLSGGTLLGAVRDQGFIPWDDDIDILMPREDFEKLKKIALYEFKEPYFLQTEDSDPDIFLGGFARFRNSNTANIEHIHMKHNANFGIWVDISILDYIYEDVNKRKKQIKKIRYYQRLLYAKIYTEFRRFLELSTFKWKIYKMAALFSSRKQILNKLEMALTQCRDSRYVTSFSYHSDKYMPFIFEKYDYRRSILLDFEWLKLSVPIDYDNILKLQYGNNYMKYPPADKRTPTHMGILNYQISYKDYLVRFDEIFDEFTDKTIVIFGAGQMLERYLRYEGKKYLPEFIVDNDKKKWETKVHGISVKQPDIILNILSNNVVVIICSVYYREISEQLKKMGINNYYVYLEQNVWLRSRK